MRAALAAALAALGHVDVTVRLSGSDLHLTRTGDRWRLDVAAAPTVTA